MQGKANKKTKGNREGRERKGWWVTRGIDSRGNERCHGCTCVCKQHFSINRKGGLLKERKGNRADGCK